jgi:hypothetical protein
VDILSKWSFLRTTNGTAGAPRVLQLQPNPGNPYREWELLQKIYNNVGTTSNCFAVWVTVGFFEVDDSVTPPKLLKEIGREENRHVRHRMFAIVDRSELAIARLSVDSSNTLSPGTNVPVTVQGEVMNTMLGQKVEIGPDANGRFEIATITSVNPPPAPPAFDATKRYPITLDSVTNTYNAGTPIVLRGNPGPMPRMLTMQAAGTAKGNVGPETVNVTGTISNKMISNIVSSGSYVDIRFNSGTTLRAQVRDLNFINPNSAQITFYNVPGPLTGGEFITFRGRTDENTPGYLQYNPRHDPAVVPHYTVIE